MHPLFITQKSSQNIQIVRLPLLLEKSWTFCRLAVCFNFFFLSSCGYRWAGDESIRSLAIPFVAGDEDGSLTTELIRAFSSSSKVQMVSSKGEYRLEVSIVSQTSETIGYRIDPQDIQGKIQKNIVADEARKILLADVCLYEGCIEKPVFGPVRISAEVDCDYVDGDSLKDLAFVDANGVPQTILAYSLGQLESVESALEAATKPLYQRLSQKIVDVISDQW